MRFLVASTLVFFLCFNLYSCKEKKKLLLKDDVAIDASDFVSFFEPVDLPFRFTDSLLKAKQKDSILINYKVFTRFAPDSVFAKYFDKSSKPKIYALGSSKTDKEIYLFIKVISNAKRMGFILAFNKKNEFVATMLAAQSDLTNSKDRITSIDKRYNIVKAQTKKNADGSISEGKDVFVLNMAAATFTLIMTDALDDKVTELLNPIDSLSVKSKYAADYGVGKKNLVSIRDGRKTDRLSFFIHLENEKSDCVSELKGEAMLQSSNLAIYKMAGDPCVLQFQFNSSAVTLKEMEGCGAHRGLRCSFDGSFAKKKSAKKKKLP